MPALTSFSSWSPRTSSSQICGADGAKGGRSSGTEATRASPWMRVSERSSTASTIDFTVRSSAMPSSSATSSQRAADGVGTLTSGADGASRFLISGSASASSMLAA